MEGGDMFEELWPGSLSLKVSFRGIESCLN